jgi:hypothetical protein
MQRDRGSTAFEIKKVEMETVICNYLCYWLIALLLSIYQGVRGAIAQLQSCEQQKIDLLIEYQSIDANPNLIEDDKPELLNEQKKKFVIYAKTKFQIWLLRAIPYSIFYFITTFSGFIALFFVYYVVSNICNIYEISGGTAALLIFSVLFGLLGVTGQLPNLLEQGKFPR